MVSKTERKRRARWRARQHAPMQAPPIPHREPSGRASRAEVDDDASPAELKRLRDMAMAGMRDQAWGTELGRLFLARRINAGEFAAGRRWAGLARDYQAAIGAPGLKSPSLERGSASSAPDPESERGRELVARDRATITDFADALAALQSVAPGAGALIERIVRDCCERDYVVAMFEEPWLKVGLAALGRYWEQERSL